MLETKRGALLAEVDGKLHQVTLKPMELTVLMELAAKMHDGVLPVLETPLTGIYLPEIEATDKSPKRSEGEGLETRVK